MIWVLGIVAIVVVVGVVVRYARRGSLAERAELRRELRRLRAQDGRPQPGYVPPVNEHNTGGHGLAGFNDAGGSVF